ncbi:hypothetical protein LMH87_011693 [Akanthomyces muscarius]|uniref:Uncharacterized protein n=2 Tax=Akanthomyces TaxID=150366 RepID=A0A162KTJ2_CORDF|nr:hypothetical protein LMH87_011693 [Akanthomyces muscarius]KAJ4150969.1 hypothetical protein LMH87_011693 [Akanthomyces muscarius]OAA79628.1 hypothetical protein LEL_03114 [Akanthomyces lecanii RCEF 1005]
MSQRPSTPVKVPSSAADYTPATLDPDLRSQINTILLRDGHVPKIQERLLHALNADASDWPTAIQNHALQLLRSGEVITFPALLRRVLDDVQEASARANGTAPPPPPTNGKTNGAASDAAAKTSLAVPQAVVEDTIRVTKECLESVCEIED